MLSNIPPLELYLPSSRLLKLFSKRYLPRCLGKYEFKNHLSQKFQTKHLTKRELKSHSHTRYFGVNFWGDHSTAQSWRVFYHRLDKDTNLLHQSLQMQLFQKANGLTQGLRGNVVITNILRRRRQRTMIHDRNAGQDTNACSTIT